MTHIKGFRPKATKKQLQFMDKYGISCRKNVNKGEAMMLVQCFTKDWSEERKLQEGVYTLHITERRELQDSLEFIRKLRCSNEV